VGRGKAVEGSHARATGHVSDSQKGGSCGVRRVSSVEDSHIQDMAGRGDTCRRPWIAGLCVRGGYRGSGSALTGDQRRYRDCHGASSPGCYHGDGCPLASVSGGGGLRLGSAGHGDGSPRPSGLADACGRSHGRARSGGFVQAAVSASSRTWPCAGVSSACCGSRSQAPPCSCNYPELSQTRRRIGSPSSGRYDARQSRQAVVRPHCPRVAPALATECALRLFCCALAARVIGCRFCCVVGAGGGVRGVGVPRVIGWSGVCATWASGGDDADVNDGGNVAQRYGCTLAETPCARLSTLSRVTVTAICPRSAVDGVECLQGGRHGAWMKCKSVEAAGCLTAPDARPGHAVRTYPADSHSSDHAHDSAIAGCGAAGFLAQPGACPLRRWVTRPSGGAIRCVLPQGDCRGEPKSQTPVYRSPERATKKE
jgi:hypothetical protein